MNGTVTIGARSYVVTVTSETPRRTVYAVSCPENAARGWKPGEVRVGIESRFVCLTCRTHPGAPCIHVAIVQRFAAAEPVPAIRTTRDDMLDALEAGRADG